VLQDATLSKARPYGVELIVAGADDDGGWFRLENDFQASVCEFLLPSPNPQGAPALYHIDAAGGVTAWRAVAIGRGAASHMARLEEGFEAGGDLAAGKALAAKALAPEGKEPRAAAVAPAASMFVPSRRRRDT